MLTIGAVDPGNSGAIAVMSQSSDAISCNENRRVGVFKFSEYGYSGMAEKLAEIDFNFVFLESVHSFPSQGVVSVWKFAENFGWWKGYFEGRGVSTTLVAPQTWQKPLGIPSVKSVGKQNHKKLLKKAAQALFPKLKVTLETADALLIYHYAKKVLENSHKP
jgi:hypothetical protein